MHWSTRRELLGVAGTALASALAGCTLFDGSDPAGREPTGTATVTGPGTTASGTVPGTTAPGTAREARMVPIPGGTYTLGTDTGPEDARPAHEVRLEPFEIDVHEVTNAAFAAFLNALDVEPVGDAPPGEVTADALRPADARRLLEGSEGEERRPLVALDDGNSRIGTADGRFYVAEGYATHPVNEVTWDGARRFARWRGARLPTEAEWEAAARGFAGRLYPWGDAEPTPERAVYGRGSGETAPVGSHPRGATPRGVQDLAGNVSEWTSSLYRPYPYAADDGREDPTVRGERVTRGGAHVFFDPRELRAYYRTGFSREFDRGHRHIGFRCARSPPRTITDRG